MVAAPEVQNVVNLAYSQSQLRNQGLQGLQARALQQQQAQQLQAQQQAELKVQQVQTEQIQQVQQNQSNTELKAYNEAVKLFNDRIALSRVTGPEYKYLKKFYQANAVEPLMLPRTTSFSITPKGEITTYTKVPEGTVGATIPTYNQISTKLPFFGGQPKIIEQPIQVSKVPSLLLSAVGFLPPSQSISQRAVTGAITKIATTPTISNFLQPIAERQLKGEQELARVSELRRTGQLPASLPYGLQPASETPVGKFQITRQLIGMINVPNSKSILGVNIPTFTTTPLSNIIKPQSQSESILDALVKGEIFAPYLEVGAAAKQKVVQKAATKEKEVVRTSGVRFSDLDEESQLNLLKDAEKINPNKYQEGLREQYRKTLESGNKENIQKVEELYKKLLGEEKAQTFFKDVKQQEVFIQEAPLIRTTPTVAKQIISEPTISKPISNVLLSVPKLKNVEKVIPLVSSVEKQKETQLDILGTSQQTKQQSNQLLGFQQLTMQQQLQIEQQKQAQPQLQKEQQKTLQLAIPALATQTLQATTQATAQKTSQLFKTPQETFTTELTVPKVPKLLFGLSEEKRKLKNKEFGISRRAYSVFTKRRGKLIELGKGLPLGRAKELGVGVARRTLARSVLIKQAGTTELEDIGFNVSPQEFRLPKRPTGGFEIQLVQRKALTRGSGEVPEILRSKKSKARRFKLF